MDLDALINIILLCIFLVISALARRQKSRKKATPAKPVKQRKKSRFAFIENIREQLRQYAEELERQARQQKREAEPDFWTELAREESGEPVAFEPGAEPRIPDPDALQPDEPRDEQRYERRQPSPPVLKKAAPPQVPDRSPVADIPLRQAVIWSEIIGKPVALRDE